MSDRIVLLWHLPALYCAKGNDGIYSGEVWVGPEEHVQPVATRLRAEPRLKRAFLAGAVLGVRKPDRTTRADIRRSRQIVRRLLTEVDPFPSERAPFASAMIQVAAEAAEGVWSVLDDVEPRDAPAGEVPAAKSAEDRVKEYVTAQLQAGVQLHQLTRDGIAKATKVSGGKVSETKTWHQISEAKRQARAPANAEEAALRAARNGDFRAVAGLQQQEMRRSRAPHR